jgi:hypothetical protein
MSQLIDASTSIPTSAPTVAERALLATQNLREALSLDVLTPKELTQLSVALVQASTLEIRQNAAFRERVLSLDREVSESTKPAPRKSAPNHAKVVKPPLVPFRQVDTQLFGPDKPLDPYLVHYAYGDDQLRDALERFPVSELKKAAATVDQRNPDTKPINRSRKDALIEYIVRYVVG